MPRTPRIASRDLIRAFHRLGFNQVSQAGSHVHLRRPGEALIVTIPVHAGKTVGVGLLKAILKQSGVTVEELRDAL